jgi:hypothetical protein
MYFDLPGLMVVWFFGAVFLAATGAGTGWLTARALQTQGPLTLWLDAMLGPLVYALILVVAKPDVARVDWALIGSFVAPVTHQAIVRFARN